MCLAIPGKIVEIVDAENYIAKVEVGGVRRGVNIGMLDDVKIGDYVLVHVGFAMSKIDEKQAAETLRTLQELGAYQEEFDQFQTAIE
jgi:hydrogenase expression/formation protein HypC